MPVDADTLTDSDRELAAQLGQHLPIVMAAGLVNGMDPDTIARRLLAQRHMLP